MAIEERTYLISINCQTVRYRWKIIAWNALKQNKTNTKKGQCMRVVVKRK